MNWYYFILWDKDWRGQWVQVVHHGPLWMSSGDAEAHAWLMRQQNNDWTRVMTVYEWNGYQWVQLKDATNWGRGTVG